MRNLLLLFSFAIAQIGVQASATNTDWDNTDGVDLVYSEGTTVKYCYYNDQPTCDCNLYQDKAAASFESLPSVGCIAIPSNPKCRMQHPTTQIWSWCGREQIIIHVSYTVEEDEYSEFLSSQDDRIDALADSLNVDPSQVVITDVVVVDSTRRMLLETQDTNQTSAGTTVEITTIGEASDITNVLDQPDGTRETSDTTNITQHAEPSSNQTRSPSTNPSMMPSTYPTSILNPLMRTGCASINVTRPNDWTSQEDLRNAIIDKTRTGMSDAEVGVWMREQSALTGETYAYIANANGNIEQWYGRPTLNFTKSGYIWGKVLGGEVNHDWNDWDSFPGIQGRDMYLTECGGVTIFDYIVVDAPVVEQSAVRARAESEAFSVAYRERVGAINPHWKPMTVDKNEYPCDEPDTSCSSLSNTTASEEPNPTIDAPTEPDTIEVTITGSGITAENYNAICQCAANSIPGYNEGCIMGTGSVTVTLMVNDKDIANAALNDPHFETNVLNGCPNEFSVERISGDGATTPTQKPTRETEAIDSGSQSMPTFFLVLTLMMSLFYY